MTKLIRTVLLDDDENVISMAETIVENSDDIERHLENWHHLKSALKKSELLDEEKVLDLSEPH